MTEQRRDCLGKWALRAGLAVMVVGFAISVAHGQSQDAVNATLTERLRANELHDVAVDRRLDGIDEKMWYGLAGIAAQLAFQLLQLGKKGRN